MTEFMNHCGRKMGLSAVYSYNKATGGQAFLPLNLLFFLHSFLLASPPFLILVEHGSSGPAVAEVDGGFLPRTAGPTLRVTVNRGESSEPSLWSGFV